MDRYTSYSPNFTSTAFSQFSKFKKSLWGIQVENCIAIVKITKILRMNIALGKRRTKKVFRRYVFIAYTKRWRYTFIKVICIVLNLTVNLTIVALCFTNYQIILRLLTSYHVLLTITVSGAAFCPLLRQKHNSSNKLTAVIVKNIVICYNHMKLLTMCGLFIACQ